MLTTRQIKIFKAIFLSDNEVYVDDLTDVLKVPKIEIYSIMDAFLRYTKLNIFLGNDVININYHSDNEKKILSHELNQFFKFNEKNQMQVVSGSYSHYILLGLLGIRTIGQIVAIYLSPIFFIFVIAYLLGFLLVYKTRLEGYVLVLFMVSFDLLVGLFLFLLVIIPFSNQVNSILLFAFFFDLLILGFSLNDALLVNKLSK